MGIRGELFSTRVLLQNRTYFFNVKENRLGDLYLNIVESKNKDEGGFDRQSVILFADDLQEFLKGFDESLRVMEKAVREKRKGPPNRGAPAERTGYPAESKTYDGRAGGSIDGSTDGSADGFTDDSERRPARSYRSTVRRGGREDEGGRGEGWRGEAPRRFARKPRDKDAAPYERKVRRDYSAEGSGRESRPYRARAEGSNFREREGRRGEGQGRPRDGYKSKDKPPFGPRKRVVVRSKR